MNAEDMLCRWAEQKWELAGVAKVEFEMDSHGPYSEVTPDIDPFMDVQITFEDGSITRREVDSYYTTKLIQEIVAFASTRTEGPQ